MGRANQHHIAKASDDQPGAAEDERSHEDVAQLRIRLDQPKQLLSIDFNHLAALDGANSRQGSAAGEHGALAGKLRGTWINNNPVRPAGWSPPLPPAPQNDKNGTG